MQWRIQGLESRKRIALSAKLYSFFVRGKGEIGPFVLDDTPSSPLEKSWIRHCYEFLL